MRLKTNPHVAEHRRVIHGGPFSAPGGGTGLLDFSSNVNPLGPPPAARRISPASLAAYPDPNSQRLKSDLGKYLGVSQRRIVAGGGASELIYRFCRAFVLEGMPVLIPAPTFGEYEAACRLSGARIIRHATMDAARDMDELLSSVPVDGCVFLCNPNNPTGGIVRRQLVRRLVRHALERGSIVLVDECFMDISSNPGESLLPAERSENLLVLRSLTKSFGLAGVRVGYGVGSAEMVSVLEEIGVPWCVSGPAQCAASAALADLSYLERSKRVVDKERAYLMRRISEISGFECLRSAANFILVRTKENPGRIRQNLLRRGILVRDCSSFAGLDGGYIRIAVRTRGDNAKLVEALASP